MKLPNGFGSIACYSGNRRRPYIVRKYIDGRHTCATMLDNAGANETAVKRILGHASQGVTKGVYTHKSLHELKKAIDMI